MLPALYPLLQSYTTANANARYEWVATAGMNGFTTPKQFQNPTDIERRQRRSGMNLFLCVDSQHVCS